MELPQGTASKTNAVNPKTVADDSNITLNATSGNGVAYEFDIVISAGGVPQYKLFDQAVEALQQGIQLQPNSVLGKLVVLFNLLQAVLQTLLQHSIEILSA